LTQENDPGEWHHYFKKENGDFVAGKLQFKTLKENKMNKNSLREIVRLVETTINKKLNESTVAPFQNKREAIFAIGDVISGTMTQKNFINQLASAKRAGTIDQNNFKLILGQLRTDAKSAGVKLEQIIDRLIDKYHPGSDVFNPNLGESVDGGWKNTFVYRKLDKKKFKVTDFKNYGSYQELFLKSDDGETDEVTLGHPMDKNGFRQTYTVNESKKIDISKKLKVGDSVTIRNGDVLKVVKLDHTNPIRSIYVEEEYSVRDMNQRGLKSSFHKQEYILTNQGKWDDKKSSDLDIISINGRNLTESKKINEAPLAAPAPVTAPAPAAPVVQGVDPAWKLDMIEFLGNSFAGMAKQFLYQAKKANPNGTADQISQLANELQKTGQISELFKTRFLTALSAAV